MQKSFLLILIFVLGNDFLFAMNDNLLKGEYHQVWKDCLQVIAVISENKDFQQLVHDIPEENFNGTLKALLDEHTFTITKKGKSSNPTIKNNVSDGKRKKFTPGDKTKLAEPILDENFHSNQNNNMFQSKLKFFSWLPDKENWNSYLQQSKALSYLCIGLISGPSFYWGTPIQGFAITGFCCIADALWHVRGNSSFAKRGLVDEQWSVFGPQGPFEWNPHCDHCLGSVNDFDDFEENISDKPLCAYRLIGITIGLVCWINALMLLYFSAHSI
jgi:hypothetical protein